MKRDEPKTVDVDSGKHCVGLPKGVAASAACKLGECGPEPRWSQVVAALGGESAHTVRVCVQLQQDEDLT